MNQKRKIVIASLLGLLIVLIAGFFIYTSDFYAADPAAVAVAGDISTQGNLTILRPSQPSETGLVFYPGGKVEHRAYLPLLERLREQGVTCVLVEMPFHLAVFNPDAATAAMAAVPEIHTWYIGGHSLGGAMASSYAAKHPDSIQGLILLGAYIYGEVPTAKTLTVYGSEDTVMDRSKLTYTENVQVIPGGNHAQFGSYGTQKGDGTATITPEDQQGQTAEAILGFIAR